MKFKIKINNIILTEVNATSEPDYYIGDIILMDLRKGSGIAKIVGKFYHLDGMIFQIDSINGQTYTIRKKEILGKLKLVNENYKLNLEDGQMYVDLVDCPIDGIKPKKIDEPIKSCNCKCDCDNTSEAPGDFQRLSKNEYYINIAKAVSKRSTCLKRQYGAVIINNDEIVSTGYNGSPRGEINCCDIGTCKRLSKPNNSGDYSDCHSVHAEQNAIISASRKEMIGATLYLYGEENGKIIEDCIPCPICSRMIKNSGIIRIVSVKGEIKL